MEGFNIRSVEPKFNASEILFHQFLSRTNVDTFLSCSDDVIAAHSSVLMKNDFFKKQIENNERNGNERLEINVKQFSIDVVMVILEYLYRGEARYFREIKREVEKATQFFFGPNTQTELQIKKEKPDSTSELPVSNNASEHLSEVPILNIKEEPTVLNSQPVNKKRRIDPFSNNSYPQCSAESSATQPTQEPVEGDSSDDSFVFDLKGGLESTVNKSKKPDKSSREDETQLNIVIQPAVENTELKLVEDDFSDDPSDDSFVFDLNEVSETPVNQSKKPDKSSKDDETQLNTVIQPTVENTALELVEDDSFVFDVNEVSESTVNQSKKPDKSSRDDETQLNRAKHGENPDGEIVRCLMNSENWKSICVVCMRRFRNIKKHIKSKKYRHQIVQLKLPEN